MTDENDKPLYLWDGIEERRKNYPRERRDLRTIINAGDREKELYCMTPLELDRLLKDIVIFQVEVQRRVDNIRPDEDAEWTYIRSKGGK